MFEYFSISKSVRISQATKNLSLRAFFKIARLPIPPAFLWISFAILFPTVPTFGQQKAATESLVRQCKPGFDDFMERKKPARSAKSRDRTESPSAAQACLEIHATPLAIQEYLQKYVRAQLWNIADEQASEDAWTFSIHLKKEELIGHTKPLSDPKMEWHGGKALVYLRTSELADGYTRVVVTARFDGYGEPEDKFAPKRESWALPSNGVLESSLTTALSKRYETIR